MAHIIVLGGGIGGVSCAYELKKSLRREDRVTLVSNKPFFQFTPSNPWVAVKLAGEGRHYHRPRDRAAEARRRIQRRRRQARACGRESH